MPTNPSVDLLSDKQPSLYYVEKGVAIIPVSGSPNNVIAANRGSLALDIASGNAYLKTSDTVASGWVIIGSGGAGNPSPPNFSVQFNFGGVFLGDAEFLYNPTTNTLTLTGILNVTTVNATTVNATNANFTNPPTLTGFTQGRVLFAGAAGVISQDAEFTYDPATNIVTVNGEIAVTTLTAASLVSTPALTLSGFTTASIPFIGAAGVVSEDNVNFNYDNAANKVTAARIQVGIPSSVSANIDMYNPTNNFVTTIRSGVALADQVFTLPTQFGAAGSVATDLAGNGVISFETPTGGNTDISAVVTNSVTQSVASTAVTAVQFPDEVTDTDAMHFTSNANLTGTVTKTAASANLVGVATLFLTELSVGQVIQVPGTADENRVVTAIASDTSLTVSVAYANSAGGQTAKRINGALVARTAGSYVVSGSFNWDAVAGGGRSLYIMYNPLIDANGTIIGSNGGPAFVGAAHPLNASTSRRFAQWDFAILYAYQDSAIGFNINANPFFAMARIAA